MKRLANLLYFLILVPFCSGSQQLVLRGDYPDPSVVKIGDTYWATATTSNWAPAYPILKSKDLVNWKTVSHVFPTLPAWADYYFWAPEITYENGKVYVYYAAHKKDGNLCLGVASADKPEGPYTDHGALMCEEVGSIDAFPMRDTDGKLYMIWKEDANSVGKPTSIWIMEMDEERKKLTGEKKELFRNTIPWEGNLVEGVSLVKHGDYIYAFYAGAGCCGGACTYATGIARSKSLFGPWEKYAKNPVLTGNQEWICPGHGTPIEKDGRYYFLYHAYDKKSSVYTGRQGLLMEYKITPDGWIEFITPATPPKPVPVSNNEYGFRERNLSEQWQWSVFQQPRYEMKGGELYLSAAPTMPGAFLGHKTLTADYIVTVKVHAEKSTAAAGLGAIGDEKNVMSVYFEDGSLKIIQLKDGKDSLLLSHKIDN
ncbi:MAG TPA: glycoside hydrolase family 43 protein, partial [Flavisolibacter sp.]|nr:glycoside hydrolase family 43 protein [Flavisolibacter sp.]